MAQSNSQTEGETWPNAKQIDRFLSNLRVKTENLYEGMVQIGQALVEQKKPEYLVVTVDPTIHRQLVFLTNVPLINVDTIPFYGIYFTGNHPLYFCSMRLGFHFCQTISWLSIFETESKINAGRDAKISVVA